MFIRARAILPTTKSTHHRRLNRPRQDFEASNHDYICNLGRWESETFVVAKIYERLKAMDIKCIPTPKAEIKSAARTNPSKSVEKLKSRPDSQSHRGRVEWASYQSYDDCTE